MRGDVPMGIHHVHGGFHVLRELIAVLDLLCHGDKRHRLCAHGVNKHIFVLQQRSSSLSVLNRVDHLPLGDLLRQDLVLLHWCHCQEGVSD